MQKKPDDTERTVGRIIRIGAALGIAGTIVVWIRYGPSTAVGFLAGTLLSLLNFHGLRRVADGLSGRRDAGFRGSPMFWVFRYVLFAAIGYVIVKILGISLMPILAGLFVAAAAIIVEILYEITYART
jgi:ATP synthase I chain